MDRHREHVVYDRRGREQEDEAPVPPRVEHVARDEDPAAPQRLPAHQRPRNRQHDHEEDREGDGREEQGSTA